MPHADPEVRAAYQKAYRQKHKETLTEHQRVTRLKRRYGISSEQYDELYMEQGGACALCGETKKVLSVDHDHNCCPGGDSRDSKNPACGKCVRGLLCVKCNTALGTLGDTVESLERVLEYLRGGVASA